MEKILFQNEDIEDDNDDFIYNQLVLKSLSLIVSSTAGAVAGLENSNRSSTSGYIGDASIKNKPEKTNTTKTPDLENSTVHEREMPFYLQQLNLSDLELKNNVQMTRKTFETLCGQIYKDQNAQEMPVEKQLLLTLWILQTQDNFLQIAERFDTNPDSLFTIFISTCKALNKLSSQAICWPENSQLSHIAEIFKEKTGLPGVIGVIGTMNITVSDSEGNSLGLVSGCLQAVCDFKLQFTNINIDSSVFDHQSFSAHEPFHRFLIDNLLTKQFYIVGDVDFPLSPSLLTPFKSNNEQLPFQAELFNKYHSLARAYIDKTFELLKHKFRRLKCLDKNLMGEIKTILTAACVLHNFILQREVDSIETFKDMEYLTKETITNIQKDTQNQILGYSNNDEMKAGIKLESVNFLTSGSFAKDNAYKDLKYEGSTKRIEIARSL